MKSSVGCFGSIAIIIAVVACFVIGLVAWGLNYDSRADIIENEIETQVENCSTELSNANYEIRLAAQVDANFQGNMAQFAEALVGDTSEDGVLSSMGLDVNALSFNLGATDLSSTAQAVIRAIEDNRGEFVECYTLLMQTKNELKDMRAGVFGELLGNITGHPREIPDNATLRPATDYDGDGKITVLDFPPVASAAATNSVKTGVEEEAPDLYQD